MALVLDTGPLIAWLDIDDADHPACVSLINSANEPLVIPAPVIVEVSWWIEKHLGQKALAAFLKDVNSGAFTVVELCPPDYARIEVLVAKYADSDLGFVDASVAAIVERLGEPKLASLDHRDFAMVRFMHGAVKLLPS